MINILKNIFNFVINIGQGIAEAEERMIRSMYGENNESNKE